MTRRRGSARVPEEPAVEARQKPRLFDRIKEVMRFKHYSVRTEEAYLGWIRRFILFHGKRYPETLGTEEVRDFLTWLALEGKVAAATQNQALSALLFLYQQVLKKEIGWLDDVERAVRPTRVPVVCTSGERGKGRPRTRAGRDDPSDGAPPVWKRIAADGVRAIAGKGCRSSL